MALTARIKTKLTFDELYAPSTITYDGVYRIATMTFNYGSVSVVYTVTYTSPSGSAISSFVRTVTDNG